MESASHNLVGKLAAVALRAQGSEGIRGVLDEAASATLRTVLNMLCDLELIQLLDEGVFLAVHPITLCEVVHLVVATLLFAEGDSMAIKALIGTEVLQAQSGPVGIGVY